jgi:GNAT superfamily N-acetyltransferase
MRDRAARHTDLSCGYYVLPPGTVANTVTWLELREPSRLIGVRPLRMEEVRAPFFETYRQLMREIGAPLLWERAMQLSDEELLALFARGDTRAFSATDDGGSLAGLVELVDRGEDGFEIAYFGLRPGLDGRGLGKRLMAAAIEIVGGEQAGNLWLHTSSFDHPAAPRFYIGCGFVAVATGFEILDDPPSNGLLPSTIAPNIPLVPPD